MYTVHSLQHNFTGDNCFGKTKLLYFGSFFSFGIVKSAIWRDGGSDVIISACLSNYII